jgi:hypothetical protein
MNNITTTPELFTEEQKRNIPNLVMNLEFENLEPIILKITDSSAMISHLDNEGVRITLVITSQNGQMYAKKIENHLV